MRYAAVILAILVIVGALGGVKGAQIASLVSAGKKLESQGPPPEAVSTAVAREEAWEGTLAAVGSVVSVRGVSLSNEAAGTVSRILFESGARARKGQVLVELDASVERAQLASARAARSLAALSFKRDQALLASQSIATAVVDTTRSELQRAQADAAAIEAQMARKVVRAPFDGRLGIRAINLGQYLSPGSMITVLEAIDTVFVDFTLPQERLSAVATGMPVRIARAGAKEGERSGALVAIDPAIDPVTRTIHLRASVPNEDEALRPGMFVNVSVVLPERASAVIVPATAVIHAAYGDSVFLVTDKKDAEGNPARAPDGKPMKTARQQFVRLGESRGDFVAVREGVAAGQEVVVAGAFKLRNDTSVVVEPDVKPAPELAPHPQDR